MTHDPQSWSSYVSVRGLQIDWQNGYKINGLPFIAYGITLPYEHMEQVELFKGLPGFMYGFATPGGIVNYVTKKPTETFTAAFELGYRAANVWSEHVDLGGRAGPDNMFGYRLNYTHEEGTPYNARNINRDTVSLGLDARLTQDLTWTFDSIYQDRRSTGQMPSFSLWSYGDTALPANVSGRIGIAGGIVLGRRGCFAGTAGETKVTRRLRRRNSNARSTTRHPLPLLAS